EWKNTALIVTVGLVNGAGWALCQNWKWANAVWGAGAFNFWRCWESSGGLSIGVAYGIAYFLVNREMSGEERAALAARRSIAGPVLPGRRAGWSGAAGPGLALALGLAWSLGRRPAPDARANPEGGDDRLERLGLHLGLLTGLGLSVRNGLKGWCNIYLGNEN